MKSLTTTGAIITNLFTNSDPDLAWRQAADIVSCISPNHHLDHVRTVFADVVHLFRGEYPGYGPIRTPYHDLPHTLDVFLCAVRLMHGMHLSGTKLTDSEISLVMIAALTHDIGYAQIKGQESGTGAQYTHTHVERGIEFMKRYFAERKFPTELTSHLEPIVYCSNPMLPISHIDFPGERYRLLGQVLGTADLVGQMADRNYLEKLVSLYQEFQEACIGNYKSVHDMMCKTEHFYSLIQKKLDDDFGALYRKLTFHFKDTLGVERNYYMESIDKNMDHLSRITAMDEPEYLALLRRGGIVKNLHSK